MGRENQPKHRQKARDLRRRKATRQPYDRLLIVCEGEKTEPQYLQEISQELRLPTAHVHVRHGELGTQPIQVVEFAERLFRKGDLGRGIEPRSFDRVYVVFDRDQHHSYQEALGKVAALDRRMINDERSEVHVFHVASVPCFELWLLLHFEDVQAPWPCKEVIGRLKAHLPDYAKGQQGIWARTKQRLESAMTRAWAQAESTGAYDGNEPYTEVGCLVSALFGLKAKGAAMR